MEIESGIQSNCSELTIRLNRRDRNKIIEELESIGIIEVIVRNKYLYSSKKEQSQWDDEITIPKITRVKDLGNEFFELYNTHGSDISDDEFETVEKTLLEKYGFNANLDGIELIEERTGSDKFGSSLSLGKDYSNPNTYMIWYTQHCQSQGFPMLKKISDYYWSAVEQYDGGSTGDYESWLNGEELDER